MKKIEKEKSLKEKVKEGIETIINEGSFRIAGRKIKVLKDEDKVEARIGNCYLACKKGELKTLANFAAVQLRK